MKTHIKQFLDKVMFIRDYRGFEKADKLEFRPGINLIVGDNGSGKSSLLQLLFDYEKYKEIYIPRYLSQGNVYYFDSEKDNPRTVKNLSHSKSIGFTLGSHFHSHGETMLPLIQVVEKEKDILLLVDEPESGISIRNQYQILKSFQKAVQNKCQLLIATHSIILIESVGEVLSLEHKKWISSKEFLESQQQQSRKQVTKTKELTDQSLSLDSKINT